MARKHPGSPILMLLAVYGLRSAEVRCLRLDDLRLGAGVAHGDALQDIANTVTPLSRSVGNAILRYLKEVRPERRTEKSS